MFKAKVIKKEYLTEKILLLTLEVSKKILNSFKPGQFIKIKILDNSFDPLFPRPFTVHYLEDNFLQILFQVVGKGTKILSELREGKEIEFLGPLGKPFPEDLEFPLALCAGGIGVAGFAYFLKNLPKPLRTNTILYYGARSVKELVRLELYQSMGISLKLATEDGSLGKRGFVTHILEEDLSANQVKSILACGPLGMLKTVKTLGEKYKIKTYLSLETFMACGTGFCLGCVIPKIDGGYYKLCVDGPTLEAKSILI